MQGWSGKISHILPFILAFHLLVAFFLIHHNPLASPCMGRMSMSVHLLVRLPMSDPRTLKLALELVARVVGREELQGLLTELEALPRQCTGGHGNGHLDRRAGGIAAEPARERANCWPNPPPSGRAGANSWLRWSRPCCYWTVAPPRPRRPW